MRSKLTTTATRLARASLLVAAAALAAGCASTPSGSYTHPAYGSTFVYRIVNTGSYGSSASDVPLRIEQATFEGREVMRVSTPSGAATLHDPATAAVIAALDAQGRTAMRYDPPLGVPWPLVAGKTEQQDIKLTVGPTSTLPMKANWTVVGAEDVTGRPATSAPGS